MNEVDSELVDLLRKAAEQPMTPQMIWDQRVSFAYGQIMENPQVTREMVERQATALYGPRPE
jgi:hypothetical protein